MKQMITDKKISANQSDLCHQCSCSKILDEDAKAESYYLMKAQEESGSVSMLNEPEEDAWDEL